MLEELLVKEPNPYFSYLDEKNFFTWLEEISAVKSFKGTKDGLKLMLECPVDDDSLYDLIAIMHRYGIEKRCLIRFLSESNQKWFKNPEAYWYESVFSA